MLSAKKKKKIKKVTQAGSDKKNKVLRPLFQIQSSVMMSQLQCLEACGQWSL